MSQFEKIQTAGGRLTILRLLAADANFTINESIIEKGVERFGFGWGRDRIRTELRWLQEQQLVEIEDLGEQGANYLIAKLTQRGLDISKGKGHVDGVERPGPGG